MSTDRTGQIIGKRFRIDALIGKGAMADVFRALDLQTSAYVALKILRASLDTRDPAGRQRFIREAEVQARLRSREETPPARFCWHCSKPLHARTDKCPFCGEKQ